MRLVIFLLIGLHCDEVVNEMMERNENILYPPPPVVYPYGGTLKFQYALPQNATIFTDYFSSRRRRDIYKLTTGWNEKKLFYQLIEHELQRPNYGNITLPSIDENYLNALEAGKRGDDCGIIYSSCPTGRGLLDYISKIV
ncbi:hypothetical protein PV328_005263 [Microctonus aethiopoides]|uniref:Uncharacterized protein n=1 Tax=Microctonus aethiopoides TaxID=144406 RepID=A0AA39FLL6_9HYME|nr:hypothetical protein PV328_005263 [Microctonus aethiopoides]